MRPNWNFIHLFLHFYVVPICKMCMQHCEAPNQNERCRRRRLHLRRGDGGEMQNEPNELSGSKEIENTKNNNDSKMKGKTKNKYLTKTMQTTIITPNGLYKVYYVKRTYASKKSCLLHTERSAYLIFVPIFQMRNKTKRNDGRKREKRNLSKLKMYKLCWWGNLKSDLYKCHSNQYENQSKTKSGWTDQPKSSFNSTIFCCLRGRIQEVVVVVVSTICVTHILQLHKIPNNNNIYFICKCG